jgi:hypothetical protein
MSNLIIFIPGLNGDPRKWSRVSESSIASRLKVSPKIRTDATFDFCNSIRINAGIAVRLGALCGPWRNAALARPRPAQGSQAFTVMQQPGHSGGRGDTWPPAACLAERSCVDSNRRDYRSSAGPAMGT